VFPVRELVNYGLGLDNPPSVKNGAVHLSAADYHAKLKEVSDFTEPSHPSQANTVVIDVRNTYEADIGRFTPVEGGAVYIDPKVSY
jgi:predicted sulfurtransferase